jgi:hypothetical protein
VKSWKTTLCGLVAAACTGLAQTPEMDPAWSHMLLTIGSIAGGIGLLFARDSNVTSEQQGLIVPSIKHESKPNPNPLL